MSPAKPLSVSATELRDAFEFVSASNMDEHSAYISIDTGKIYWVSDALESEEENPDDLESSDRYIAVPHKRELDLGRHLVLAFARRELPHDYQTVIEYFRRKGGYSRFKALLHARGALERWYEYEDRASEEALLRWCEENGIQLVGGT
jgi:Uncharacterised protein family (UPF0158)